MDFNPAVQNAPIPELNLDALMPHQDQMAAVRMEVDSFNLSVDSSGLELQEVDQEDELEPIVVLALPAEPTNYLHVEIQPHELNVVESQKSSPIANEFGDLAPSNVESAVEGSSLPLTLVVV
jgi:hypothetical protein